MRQVNARLQERFPGLRASHLPIYQHIDHPPDGTRLTDLADRIQVSKQGLIETIDDMDRGGFVERTADPRDRRAKLIRLTDLGMAVHEGATEVVTALQEEWTDQLGPGEMAELLRLLHRLNALVGADPGHG